MAGFWQDFGRIFGRILAGFLTGFWPDFGRIFGRILAGFLAGS